MKPRIDPDEFDLAQLKECVESPGYRLITTRLAETWSRELKKLAEAANWDNVRYVQGILAGLNVAADVPKILAQEIRARAQMKKKANG